MLEASGSLNIDSIAASSDEDPCETTFNIFISKRIGVDVFEASLQRCQGMTEYDSLDGSQEMYRVKLPALIENVRI